MQQRWDDDLNLLEDLADAVRDVAVVTSRIAEQARGALVWRAVDDDLLFASLSFDSCVQSAGPTRAEADDTRILVFSASPLSVELEVTRAGAVGQIVPPSAAQILVETADGATVRLDADDSGFFMVPALPEGPARFRCDTATGRVVTDWVRL